MIITVHSDGTGAIKNTIRLPFTHISDSARKALKIKELGEYDFAIGKPERERYSVETKMIGASIHQSLVYNAPRAFDPPSSPPSGASLKDRAMHAHNARECEKEYADFLDLSRRSKSSYGIIRALIHYVLGWVAEQRNLSDDYRNRAVYSIPDSVVHLYAAKLDEPDEMVWYDYEKELYRPRTELVINDELMGVFALMAKVNLPLKLGYKITIEPREVRSMAELGAFISRCEARDTDKMQVKCINKCDTCISRSFCDGNNEIPF